VTVPGAASGGTIPVEVIHVDQAESSNQVLLRGRVSAGPDERELPSGDRIVTFRLVVARDQTAMTKGSRQLSDWVDCSAWGGRVRSRALTWQTGDEVEVRGSLRRRYFRSAGGDGAGTRLEVEMLGGRRCGRRRADAPESTGAQAQ
jgi:single-strand DNA-binding protein